MTSHTHEIYRKENVTLPFYNAGIERINKFVAIYKCKHVFWVFGYLNISVQSLSFLDLLIV